MQTSNILNAPTLSEMEARAQRFFSLEEEDQVQTYAITIQATAERTFILAAASQAEAEARAKEFFDFTDCMTDPQVVEAEAIEEAHDPDCPATDGFSCRCKD